MGKKKKSIDAFEYWRKRRSLKRRIVYHLKSFGSLLMLYFIALLFVFLCIHLFKEAGSIFLAGLIIFIIFGVGLIDSEIQEKVRFHEYQLDREEFAKDIKRGDIPPFAPIYIDSTGRTRIDPSDLIQCGKARELLEKMRNFPKDVILD
ncbi:MAG: hypothetical protein COV29_01800 [Candidatus Yanofskybacteria bacterium CG10_big_fil_rev_8_21_14_0_10_36_16]|uniref:Uncharacterized protein n=1 Tax=Candidatus Yanofskybacteria bacterium CG10_big_fil_rev_8_21_14_0_10_36_16 TaxID=1975096 RepID=A0A2J0Q7J6_9BACT|nr:MAG: hypothetical protein COV29_01800 [Candidatus Yanofskybacteria bacterium CG10_big_fil_rev_8_21_14_0_10_36_16]